MKLVTFRDAGSLRGGVVVGNSIIPFIDPSVPLTILNMRDQGNRTMATDPSDMHAEVVALASASLGPSVPEPRNIICVGKNYALHAAEEGVDVPASPLLFSKHTSTVSGPYDQIVWDPAYATQVDYEAELVVVIGETARRVSETDALDVVFGYTVANDVSARDIQFGDVQWLRGKSLDGFMPIGPIIVTPDELDDPQSLNIECRVNGEVRQQSNTSLMYHSIRAIVSYCSQAFTLQPGDVILTGTPAGVGIFAEPPALLKDGDLVEVEVEGIGVLRNECVEEPAESHRMRAKAASASNREES